MSEDFFSDRYSDGALDYGISQDFSSDRYSDSALDYGMSEDFFQTGTLTNVLKYMQLPPKPCMHQNKKSARTSTYTSCSSSSSSVLLLSSSSLSASLEPDSAELLWCCAFC